MRDETIARNYAEALFELAERHEGCRGPYGTGIEVVARLIDGNDDFRRFLQTPRIAVGQKKAVVRRVFGETLPAKLVNFLLITLDKRRQTSPEGDRSGVHEPHGPALQPDSCGGDACSQTGRGLHGGNRAAADHGRWGKDPPFRTSRVKPGILGGAIVRDRRHDLRWIAEAQARGHAPKVY